MVLIYDAGSGSAMPGRVCGVRAGIVYQWNRFRIDFRVDIQIGLKDWIFYDWVDRLALCR